MSSPPPAENLRQRDRIIRAARSFFYKNDFTEVETPCRMPSPAPEPHIEPVPSGNHFLQTSPELCMKRLLAAGHERIFQFCRCFRGEERGELHLPEFTLLEWYAAGMDYFGMMDQTQEMIRRTALDVLGTDQVIFQGEAVDLSPPWPGMTVEEAFEAYSSVPMETALASDRFDEIIGIEISPHLGRKKPLFLYDYPAACGALARLKPGSPRIAERFELYICGIELCNAFSELTDPEEQRKRFEADMETRRKAGKPVWPLPEAFLSELADMPPAAGNALGVDRLVMILADAPRIDDVAAFTPESL